MRVPFHRLALLFAAFALFALTGMRPAGAGESGPGAAAPQPAVTDISRISVTLDTLTALNGKKGDIEVLQLIRIFNSGDAPYFGEPAEDPAGNGGAMPRTVFRVPIPEGAFDIAPSDISNPQGMTEGPAGITTTAPLPPGETLVSFIYRVRPSRSGWALRRQIDYPTQSINLLLGPGLELASAPGFKLTERKKLGEVEYRRFRAGPFSPGSVLTADIGFGGDSPRRVWLGFASAAAVLAAAGLGSAMMIRRRRPSSPASKPALDSDPKDAGGREDLILQIALLDEEFDSGSIPQPAYESKRRVLKEKLQTLSESVKQ